MGHRSSHPTLLQKFAAIAFSALLVVPIPAIARVPGGPRDVGSPTLGVSGVPMTWNPAAMPIHYRVDPGPMAISPSGTVVIDNAAGRARVQNMFNTWANVPTASITFQNDGQLLSSGPYTGGPVSSGGNGVANFNALMASCDNGEQSPVIFDPNGNLFSDLGFGADIIGFAFACAFDPAAGHIKAAGLAMNGIFQDGDSTNNFELTANAFNQTITHEIGHFLGLDHSQINVEILNGKPLHCNTADDEGLPIMFPVLFCQDRVTAGFPALAPDDMAWISRLYPVTSPAAGKTVTNSAYGTISGTVYFTDGLTAAQGVNIIARQVGNPRSVAFSVVSGYLFTGNPGQTVTCQDPSNPTPSTCTNLGSSFGSHNTTQIGTFDIPVAPGTYTLQVESINSSFVAGSGVGPLRVPIPAPGTASPLGTISVRAGATAVANITLQGTPSRFDAFENAALGVHDDLWLWQRRENSLVGWP
jgi:reprolysin-like metallo-peptidase family M12B